MRTIEKTVYLFTELSDRAKESARDWWRSCENELSCFAECVLEDAVNIGDILGIDLNTPNIFYSGFSSQGDGACFEGTYKYKKGALSTLVKNIGATSKGDIELLRICKELQEVQKRYFYQLTATMTHSGHYYHSGCMRVSVDCGDDRETSKGEDEITQLMREFADYIYDQLEQSYDFTMSDENVDENITINGYEFSESGAIA